MPGECVLPYSRAKKRLSRLMKIFPKGLVHGFVKKSAIF